MNQEQNNGGLQELRHSDYHLSDDQPDVQGWPVYDGQHQRIGKVHDLLFDPQQERVRYIITKMSDDVSGAPAEQVLIPIGMAELHDKDDEVILPGVTGREISQFSPYPFDALKNNATQGSALPLEDQSTHSHFNDENFYRNRPQYQKSPDAVIPIVEENLQVGKKTVQTGGIRLRSRIVERPVEQTVTLKQETVDIERTPVDRPADATALHETQLQAASYSEVPVVDKEARVVEEVRLNKQATEKDQKIQDTVRKTEVDVDRTSPQNRLSDQL